jgi:hypothetical protein
MCLILALNVFVSADGESVGIFDPSSIEHPVLAAGDAGSASVIPETDPHLGPLHQTFLVQNTSSAQGHNSSLFSGSLRPLPDLDKRASTCTDLPGCSRHSAPVSIGMKLLFPEHYFW